VVVGQHIGPCRKGFPTSYQLSERWFYFIKADAGVGQPTQVGLQAGKKPIEAFLVVFTLEKTIRVLGNGVSSKAYGHRLDFPVIQSV
jgi:hypothetical protein